MLSLWQIFADCIKTLLKAPRSSPLSQVSKDVVHTPVRVCSQCQSQVLPLKVAQFMVYLTDPRSLMASVEVRGPSDPL